MKRVLSIISFTLLLFYSKFAFSQITAWGNKFYGGEPTFSDEYISASTGDLSTGIAGVASIISNRYAVAVLKQDGSIVTFGHKNYGGSTTTSNSDTNPATGDLSSGVVNIVSNETAFAALKSDGSVVTWGLKVNGGDHTFSNGTSQGSTQAANGSLSSGVTKIVSNDEAFTALKSDGSVVTWGKIIAGGNYNLTASGVSAANGDLSSGVADIYGRGMNFVALKTNGSVVTWGWTSNGGSSTVTQGNNLAANGDLTSGVEKIYYNNGAFVAKKSYGGLVSWGYNYSGGNYDYSTQYVDALQCVSPSCTGDLTSGVDNVFPLQDGFLATKTDGSVFFWGGSSSNPNYAPNSSYSTANGTLTNIIDVVHHNYSYAALKSDGSVVTWGERNAGGDFDFSDDNTAAKSGDLSNGVVAIYKSSYYDYNDMMMEGAYGKSFVALKSDGSVVTWGAKIAGGSLSYTDSKTVAASGDLSSGVVGIYAPNSDYGGAYIALKNDGSIVSWGNAKNGGNLNFSDSATTPISFDFTTNKITDIHVTFYAAYLATYTTYDIIAPSLTLNGNSEITIEVGSTYSDAGATAEDNIDGDLTESITTTNNVDTSAVGTYKVTYSITDSSANTTQITRQVNVVDTKTIPVINLVGNPTILVEKGSVYIDQGATALDSHDGSLTDSMVTTSNVDTNTAAAYTIRYNVSDPSGNDAIEVVRTVIVVEVPFKNNNTSLTGVESKSNIASGIYSTAMGKDTTASGNYSTAMGINTIATKQGSVAMGAHTVSDGLESMAFGIATTASGNYSTAMGYNTESSGVSSTAMGSETTASGDGSFAAGVSNVASGAFGSTALGSGSEASGVASTAIGDQVNAFGNHSAALGFFTTASGHSSTALGFGSLASGNYGATAIGSHSIASGNTSTAMGYYTTAEDHYSLVIGVHNKTDETPNPENFSYQNTAFVIGNGGHDSEGNYVGTSDTFSNAFEVLFDGTTTIAGDLSINSDARLKANIISLGSTLAKLLQIDGKTYTMKKDESEKQKIGLLAQDLEKVFPELVSESKGIKSVNYQGLVPVLINAIKDQDVLMKEQEKILSEQKSELDKLKALVHNLIEKQ